VDESKLPALVDRFTASAWSGRGLVDEGVAPLNTDRGAKIGLRGDRPFEIMNKIGSQDL